jgi:hypothetical protein
MDSRKLLARSSRAHDDGQTDVSGTANSRMSRACWFSRWSRRARQADGVSRDNLAVTSTWREIALSGYTWKFCNPKACCLVSLRAMSSNSGHAFYASTPAYETRLADFPNCETCRFGWRSQWR